MPTAGFAPRQWEGRNRTLAPTWIQGSRVLPRLPGQPQRSRFARRRLDLVAQFISQYGLFLAEALTVLAVLLVVIARIGGLALRGHGGDREGLRVRRLNHRLRNLQRSLERDILADKDWKALRKEDKAARKLEHKEGSPRRRVFVLDFHGDMRASAVTSLREEVTAVLAVARPADEVLLRLESPGGMVHSYGLASSQLARLRDGGVKLTAAVDKIAASGGYMMACVADQIVAAPFAVLGSIGVVAQVPNLHRFLQKHEVDIELHTAGEFKRTLTVLGENTDKGREKFRQELEETHGLFKEFVHKQRPQLDVEKVATGEHWYGQQALGLGLCDALLTSDAWLVHAAKEADLFELRFEPERSVSQRLSGMLGDLSARVLDLAAERLQSRHLP